MNMRTTHAAARGWLVAAVAAIALLGARPASAWDLGVDVGVKSIALVTNSSTAFAGDGSLSGTCIDGGFTFDSGWGVHLTWHTWWTGGSVLGSASLASIYTDAVADQWTVGVSRRWQPLPWLRPYARASLGAYTSVLTLSDGSGSASGRQVAPALSAAGGIEVVLAPRTISKRTDLTFGLNFELGWNHIAKHNAEVTLDRAGNAATVDLGALRWSGRSVRFGLVVRL